MGLIQFEQRLLKQPQGLVKPSDRWLKRGLVYASTLANRYDAVSGIVATIVGTKPQATSWGMALGFGATLGVGSTDRLETPIDYNSTLRTYIVRFRRNGAGAGGYARLFDNGTQGLAWDATNSWWNFYVNRSTANGSFRPPLTSAHLTATDYVLAWSYDAASTSNTPEWYVNGESVSNVTLSVPSGSVTAASNPIYVGNNFSSIRNFDGVISDLLIFDSILGKSEISELADTNRVWKPSRIEVPVSAGGDVSLALSGAAATSAAGNTSAGTSTALTGVSSTAATGTLATATSVALSGISSTSAAGTLAASISAALTGVSSTAAAGTLSAGGDASAAVTGQAASTAQGTLGVTVSGAAALSGASAAASAGTLSAGISTALTGASAAVSAGSLTAGGDVSVTIAGQAVSTAQGTVGVTATGAVTVALTGAAAVVAAGNIFVVAPAVGWTPVDDSDPNAWIPVDDSNAALWV